MAPASDYFELPLVNKHIPLPFAVRHHSGCIPRHLLDVSLPLLLRCLYQADLFSYESKIKKS